MKLALDCRSACEGFHGIGRYTWSLLHEFTTLAGNHEVFCYFSHVSPPAPVNLPGNFRIRICKAGMVDDRFDQFVLPGIIEEDEIDVYHNPTFSVPTIRGRTRIVSTVHDAVFARRPDLVAPRLREFLDSATRRAGKLADRIITVSEFSKTDITGAYGISPDRVRVILNGVTPPPIGAANAGGPDAHRRLGIEGKKYILYVGSIEPKKNLGQLLGALDLLRAEDPNCPTLVVAGGLGADGEDILADLKRREAAGQVVHAGYVSDADLEVLYAGAGLFVYPSLYEGFGLPPLEAMLRGVPTIVADATSLPELVEHAALKVDPGNVQALAAAISQVLGNEEIRRHLSEAGRSRAAMFTWKRSAAAHLEFYEELAGVPR